MPTGTFFLPTARGIAAICGMYAMKSEMVTVMHRDDWHPACTTSGDEGKVLNQ
jgi:hypothetical protein